jgi:hypothetical protein
MALTSNKLTQLRKACDQLDDGPDYRCEDYVDNLLNSARTALPREIASLFETVSRGVISSDQYIMAVLCRT